MPKYAVLRQSEFTLSLQEERFSQETIDPLEFGIERATLDQLRTGSLEEAAALLRSILSGEPSPALDITLLNAAGALVVGEAAGSFRDGIDAARRAIESGNAARTLETLASVSNA